ncbi:MAG: FAD-dependent oxidoreductase [Saprospiraceae bacterium]|nr:FAD-dependent oxidoreductase [Saprospiraceae bacterium]
MYTSIIKKSILFFFLVSMIHWSCSEVEEQNVQKTDILVYGGTSAGVTAAVQAARSGKSVILVSPTIHLGGLSSGGLGFTDTGNKEVIGGLSREFYQKLYTHYQEDENWAWQPRSEYGNKGQGTPAIDGDKRTMWIFEPHAAEMVFEDLIKQENIEVVRDECLNRENGVVVIDQKVKSITTLSGMKYEAQVFIDATYEGDLMAASGVSYHVGRESNAQYGETWNGVQTNVFHHGHQFETDISAYKIPGDPTSGVLPRISTDPPGIKGQGDHRIQAYCFRMCLSNHPDNQVPFLKPDDYDRSQYELLSRIYASGWDETFQKFDPIPNRKTDTNNHGPFSTDNIGMNYTYPEGSYEERRAIVAEHESYQRGLMYFLTNDSTVPENIRDKMQTWGLARDEFSDNGHWPYQIYVREARRMIGAYVMTENEIMDRRQVPESIGMGSYGMDSHNTQRYVTEEGFVQNEGDIGVRPPKPYQIDYGAIIPKEGEISNLLVPVCVSSSHIAYGSIRMEPVFMILGQSAAVAASLCIDQQIGVQELAYPDLESSLINLGQILAYETQAD